MNTGPRATFGFDLALTELLDPHRFVVEVGSERGAAFLSRTGAAPATSSDVATGEAVVESTSRSMGRRMDTTDIKELLYRNPEHPRWDDVADRCLSCTNCTLVCPTCFCSSVEDTSDLAGETAERWRRWDSCFTLDHSYLHGGSIRASTKSRYRQWLTHKVASWIDQFGVSGCIGCGRCITWCPVGIDITEEVAAIRATDGVRDGAET
jgi:ferredoxin